MTAEEWSALVRARLGSAVHARCFELVGGQTASVRDQMVRASSLLAALCLGKPNLLGPDAPLLVVGGGAAGITAALAAYAMGVPTVLVEKESQVLLRQREVSSRWLDPTEFDFPQAQWAQAAWPPGGSRSAASPPLPVAYVPGWASDLAALWDRHWNQALQKAEAQTDQGGPFLLGLTGCEEVEASDFDFRDDHVEWLRPDARSPVRRFGAVVSCVGMGEEQVSGADGSAFRGVAFWHTDPLCNRGLGLGHVGPLSVLVSGGGDGAQQDIQRVLCADFGRRLVQRLDPSWSRALGRLVDAGQLLAAETARMEARRLASALDVARADLAWETAFRTAAEGVWHSSTTAQRRAAQRALLRPEALQAPIHLTWLLRDGQPSFCYGLNRVLTEWVLLAYQEATGRSLRGTMPARLNPSDNPIVLSGWQLSSLSPADGHACSKVHRSHSCTTLPHHLVAVPAAGGAEVSLGRFDAIVVRHGLSRAALFGGVSQGPWLMPFDWLSS